MSEPVDLAEQRRIRLADEEMDCRHLTVLDALRGLVSTLEELPEDERPDKLLLRTWREEDNDYLFWDRYAGVTRLETLGMLCRLQHETLHEGGGD